MHARSCYIVFHCSQTHSKLVTSSQERALEDYISASVMLLSLTFSNLLRNIREIWVQKYRAKIGSIEKRDLGRKKAIFIYHYAE